MANTTFQVQGLSELLRRARKLPAAMEKKVYRRAVQKAGEVVKKAAMSKVPVDTGTTKRSLVVRVSSKPSKGLFGVKITVKGGALASQRVSRRRGKGAGYHPDAVERYYRFTELGTKHHPAQPYLKPSLEGSAGEVFSVIRNELASGLEKAVREL